MDSADLTPDQARILREQLAPTHRYLAALRERMVQQAWPADDKVRRLVETAYNAVFELSVELHYLSVEHGVGRPPRR
jgi:hypothetical protein